MATTAIKPEVSTFSYAQAAKGLAASSTSQNAKTTDQSGKSTQDSEVTKSSGPEHTANSVSAESSRLSEKAESIADHESKSATTGSTKNAVSGASSPSFGTASTSTLAKEDEIPTITNGDSHWENKSQASATADKSNTNNDKDEKKDDSAKPADKNLPLKELKAAPPPAVNVWQQRKEAQEAKAKASAAMLKSANTATKAIPSKPASPALDTTKAANKKKTANDSQADASSSVNKDRKRVENGKLREEESDIAPPPVADSTAWPTPQTALGEEKRKAQEKNDKSEKVEKTPAPRGKEKWTPVQYVPTAVFNTPLPSGARRGGRASRGGREGGRGGAHSSNSTANNSTTAPGDAKSAATQPNQAQPKQHASLPDRGRNEGGLARANSLPAQARKPVTTEANAQQGEQRRFPPNSERPRVDTRPKATEENNAAPNGTAYPPVDAAAKTYREPRSAKAPEFIPAHKASDHSPRSGSSPSDAQGNGRFVPNHERRFDNTKSVDTSRDVNGFVPRDREFKDYTREKGEYQRDHQKERGESRPERGRGTYRGRGNHSYNSPHNQHFQNSQVPQHPFVPKSFSAGDRQRSQHQNFQNGTQPQHVNHRLSLRSPPMPNSAGLYSAYPVPDINTMYPSYHVAPGPMSAIPYQPYMEPFNLFTLIQMQLEYYFSVDNLCKDLYLRKHMDSQGFVRLSFIAGFKRIRNLTEDFEMLRHCGRQLRNAEYILSEDGLDLLRPREKWEHWVLPMDQRDSSAQNDGNAAAALHPIEGNNFAAPVANGVNHNDYQGAPNGLPNGVHEQADPQTTLSSAAPEFTPYVAVGDHNENPNGTAQ
ncbi:La domain family [Talaromyces stipitatus ATCC 10500]|uniref:La domain family n=1 Tax=Talaromyces stipitatus (strain ATCC 10500 / CBS 375.48 / QM 6759 / NRRL 1006) TaxID=441959 RepID=B8LVK2_TALSN|nr:La domain family [Talaromyces stipitatus ATCC 10500]EED24021.1 La domain family [Talaromyces stipitatus ATCC 10500]